MRIPTCVMLLFMAFGYGQQLEREVIGSAGETISNGDTILDFTVGETIVGHVSNTSIALSQGFHQTYVSLSVKISPIVFLQGALLNPSSGEENLMRDNLRQLYVPTTSPYSDNLTCDVSVFLDGGALGTGVIDDNIVDWVYIELRDKNDNTNVIAERSALLQRDGDVVDVDGISSVNILTEVDDYYVAIRHRNHLGIMTANTVSLSKSITNLDFTASNNQITYGSNAQTSFGTPSNTVAMWAGNVNGDTIVQYVGSNPDSPSILSNALNDPGNFFNFSTYTVNGYNVNDVDLNGGAQYVGSMPDSPFILQNVLAHPSNFFKFSTYKINEQLPEN